MHSEQGRSLSAGICGGGDKSNIREWICLCVGDRRGARLTYRGATVGWNCMRSTHAFHRQTTSVPWARERMSAAERASKATSAQQANEWVMRANERANEQANEQANERADERVTEYSTRRFRIISTQSASIWDFFWERGWRNFVFHHMGMAFLSVETWCKERNRWLTCSLTAG